MTSTRDEDEICFYNGRWSRLMDGWLCHKTGGKWRHLLRQNKKLFPVPFPSWIQRKIMSNRLAYDRPILCLTVSRCLNESAECGASSYMSSLFLLRVCVHLSLLFCQQFLPHCCYCCVCLCVYVGLCFCVCVYGLWACVCVSSCVGVGVYVLWMGGWVCGINHFEELMGIDHIAAAA